MASSTNSNSITSMSTSKNSPHTDPTTITLTCTALRTNTVYFEGTTPQKTLPSTQGPRFYS